MVLRPKKRQWVKTASDECPITSSGGAVLASLYRVPPAQQTPHIPVHACSASELPSPVHYGTNDASHITAVEASMQLFPESVRYETRKRYYQGAGLLGPADSVRMWLEALQAIRRGWNHGQMEDEAESISD